MSEDAGEKTNAPTEKRLRDAAKRGDVLRSRDLGNAASVLAGALFLRFAGPWLFDALTGTVRAGLVWNRADIDDFAPGRVMLAMAALCLPPVLLLAFATMGAGVAAQLLPAGAGRWVPGNAAPKASRLSPLSGLKRMFGLNGLIELGKGLAKAGLLAAIAWQWGRSHLPELAGLGGARLSAQVAAGWGALVSLLTALAGGLIVIALFDFPIQWWRRRSRLMMSQQQVRDEHKESEGSPERKAAQRSRQRQLAMGGVAKAMREAQLVLTNPSRFAVAMVYDPSRAAAPIVLAKGRGAKAAAIRELAAENGVPCLEYPGLARSLYFTTRERQVIREELYAAVASVLAFVLSLKRGEKPALPRIDVPIELRFDADGRADPKAA